MHAHTYTRTSMHKHPYFRSNKGCAISLERPIYHDLLHFLHVHVSPINSSLVRRFGITSTPHVPRAFSCLGHAFLPQLTRATDTRTAYLRHNIPLAKPALISCLLLHCLAPFSYVFLAQKSFSRSLLCLPAYQIRPQTSTCLPPAFHLSSCLAQELHLPCTN